MPAFRDKPFRDVVEDLRARIIQQREAYRPTAAARKTGILTQKTYSLNCEGCGRVLGKVEFPITQIVFDHQLRGHLCQKRACQRLKVRR